MRHQPARRKRAGDDRVVATTDRATAMPDVLQKAHLQDAFAGRRFKAPVVPGRWVLSRLGPDRSTRLCRTRGYHAGVFDHHTVAGVAIRPSLLRPGDGDRQGPGQDDQRQVAARSDSEGCHGGGLRCRENRAKRRPGRGRPVARPPCRRQGGPVTSPVFFGPA